MQDCAQAALVAPNGALYWVNLVNAECQAGERDRAVSAARRALMLEPANGPGMQVPAVALSPMCRPAAALTVFEQPDSAGAHDADSLARHGYTWLQMLRPDLATHVWLRAPCHALPLDASWYPILNADSVPWICATRCPA